MDTCGVKLSGNTGNLSQDGGEEDEERVDGRGSQSNLKAPQENLIILMLK